MIRANNTIFFMLLFIFAGWRSTAQSNFIIGQDLSYANMMEDCGAQFREDGKIKDIYQIFADNGTNLVRVRLWNNPDWQDNIKQPAGVKAQYNNFEDAKETIFRAKMAGMKVMLGFHFSDFWADPGKQIIPKAWEGVANNETTLADSVYNYVFGILTTLDIEDLMPEYVKIGNENNSGIMTYKGMNSNYEGITLISNSWARHGKMYNAAIKAVRDASANSSIKPKIALHVAGAENAEWFYNNIISNGVTDFDIMGFTYYYSYGEKSPAYVGNVIKKLKSQHPNYEAMVVETGYLWSTKNIDGLANIITESSPDYQPVSPGTQKKFMVDLSNVVKNAGGSGVIFWEPDWVSTPCSTPWGTGSSQEHVAFFDYNNNLNYMKNGGGGWPDEFFNSTGKTTSNVTFQVDMTNQDISRGVFVVGTMTNWEFIPLDPLTNNANIYQATLELNIGDVHAFYFITTNSWDNYLDYRETVPEECANSDELLNDPEWTTDRAFTVPDHDTIMANVWASCETFTATSDLSVLKGIYIYPNPATRERIILENNSNQPVTSIEIVNLSGQVQPIKTPTINKNCQTQIDISHLNRGIYFIQLKFGERMLTKKIIVN